MFPLSSGVLAEVQLALRTTKIVKLGLLSLPSLVFNKKFPISKLEAYVNSALPVHELRPLWFHAVVLTIRPQMRCNRGFPTTTYT